MRACVWCLGLYRHDPGAIPRDGERPDLAAVADQRLHAVLRLQLPQLGQRVLRRRDEQRAVRVLQKVHVRHGVLVALKPALAGLRDGVPHHDVGVLAGRRQQVARAVESQRRDALLVPMEGDRALAVAERPDADGAVAVAGGDGLAVGAAPQRRHLRPQLRLPERLGPRPRPQVPQHDAGERRCDGMLAAPVELDVGAAGADHAEARRLGVAQVAFDHLRPAAALPSAAQRQAVARRSRTRAAARAGSRIDREVFSR